MPDIETQETVMAFDFGLRRIGVAVGQNITGSASPLGVVNNGENGPDFEHVEKLVGEWHPNRLIVGRPTHLDGSDSDLEPAIQAFVAALDRFGLPIERIGERHTSQEAERTLIRARQSGSRGRISKEDIDSAAAVMIAERYLRKNL